MAIKLPPNARPLDPVQFAQRFPVLTTDMALHVTAKLGYPDTPEQARVRLFNACAPGILQIAQLVEINGEPGVFARPGKELSDDGARYAEALVSYFDTTGSFDAKTGDLVTSEQIARVGQIAQQLKTYDISEGASDGTLLGVAFAIDELGLKTSDFVEGFAAWKAAHPERDGGDYFDTFVPKDREAELAAKYAKFKDDVHRYHRAMQDSDPSFAGLVNLLDAEIAEREALLQQLKANGLPEDRLRSLDGAPMTAVQQAAALTAEIAAREQELADLTELLNAPRAFHKAMAEALQGVTPREAADDWQEARKRDRSVTLDEWRRDFLRRRAPAQPSLVDWIREEYPDAVDRLSREVNISKRIVLETLSRWAEQKLLQFSRVDNRVAAVLALDGWPTETARSERLIRDAFARVFPSFAKTDPNGPVVWNSGEPGVPLDSVVGKHVRPGEHTYMRAIEAQYGALADMTFAANKARSEGRTHFQGMSIQELFDVDIAALKRADTFCWFEEPTLAVEAAAESLPDSVKLTRDLTEGYAGWWYFTLPQEIHTLSTPEPVQALLWAWGDRALQFSTYVPADETVMKPGAVRVFPSGLLPTAKFRWVEGESLAHMLQRQRREHAARYANASSELAASLTGVDETVKSIEKIARFYIAGCLWTQQKILVQAKGHIERHARKRMEKADAFNRPLSAVQIIQLRAKESVGSFEKNPNPQARDWKCRWVVKGFWRNQYYPSKGHYEPKWIDPYVKGPADRPLKVPTHRVYVVNR